MWKTIKIWEAAVQQNSNDTIIIIIIIIIIKIKQSVTAETTW
jgi:hypothetical protein